MTDGPQDKPGTTTWESHLLELAWGVIANAGMSGAPKSPGWQEAAERWRDAYHTWLGAHTETWGEIALRLTHERDELVGEVARLGRRLQAQALAVSEDAL